MSGGLSLGCAEFAVPGTTLEDKLRTLELQGMWLELVNDGRKRPKDVLNAQKSFGAQIKSVQAYLLHELELLDERKVQQNAAARHVEDTIKLASEVGAMNVVTTIAYGAPKIENPRKRCIELFRNFGKLAEEFNVTVSIEPLGRDRTSFLPSTSEVHQLVKDVDSDYVRLMADTMHIYNSGENVVGAVRKYMADIMELQLRDTNSRPPGMGKIDFAPVLKFVREKFKGLLCLEYRPGQNPSADFNHAIKFVSGAIPAAR